MRLSTHMSCKTCWRDWTKRIKPSFAGYNGERRRASRAIGAATDGIPSLTRSMATERRWTVWATASWSCRRLAGLLCAGHVRWKAHPRPSRSPKNKEADGWYVCFSCAEAPVQPLPTTGEETGIDLGIEAFATLPDGTRMFSPGWYRKAERALKTAQRRVSRRKKGSRRRRKTVTLLAKAHQTVRRQRADFHHKTALALV